jgi:hypothetical protein
MADQKLTTEDRLGKLEAFMTRVAAWVAILGLGGLTALGFFAWEYRTLSNLKKQIDDLPGTIKTQITDVEAAELEKFKASLVTARQGLLSKGLIGYEVHLVDFSNDPSLINHTGPCVNGDFRNSAPKDVTFDKQYDPKTVVVLTSITKLLASTPGSIRYEVVTGTPSSDKAQIYLQTFCDTQIVWANVHLLVIGAPQT